MSYADKVFIDMCTDIIENGTDTRGEKVAAKLSYVADGLSKLFGQGELPPALGEKEE